LVRSKETTAIEGLRATAETISRGLLGPAGLARVAHASHANAVQLRQDLTAIEGVSSPFGAAVFHEFVIQLQTPVAPVLQALQAQGILGGRSLVGDYPELGQSMLVCATETKTVADLGRYAENMAHIIGRQFQPAPCAIQSS